MKKLSIFLLVITMIFFTACGGGNDLSDAFSDMSGSADGDSERSSDRDAEEVEEEIPVEVTGRYELVKVQRLDQEISGDDLEIRKMQDDYVYILENDEIELVLSSEVYPVEQLELINDYEEAYFETKILKFDFSLKDGMITLYETDREETYIFEYNPDSTERLPYTEPEFVEPVVIFETPMRSVDYISDPDVMQSMWYGTFTISEYDSYPHMNGTYDAQAILTHDNEGGYYFALSPKLDGSNAQAIAFFLVEVKEDTFYPIINERSKYNGTLMSAENAITYAPTLKDGILSARYYFVNEELGESAIFDYELARRDFISEKFEIKKDEYYDGIHAYYDEPVHTTAELAELFKSFDYYGKTFDEFKEYFGGTQPYNFSHEPGEAIFAYYATDSDTARASYLFTDEDGKMTITYAYQEELVSHQEEQAVIAEFGKEE